MTPDPDIERVLERWFTEGPTQMPDRLFEFVDHIDRLPQRRLARIQTRLFAMNIDLRLAVTAAVIVAVAVTGAVVLTRAQEVGVGALHPVPAALQAEWRPVGPRDLPGLSRPHPADLDIVIDQTTITIFDFHRDVLTSASLVGASSLEVHMLNKGWYWHCQLDDAGTYMFSLTAGGRNLTLTPVRDACAERETILAGDWTRTDIGNLALGRHVSALFRRFGDGTLAQVSYTVPAGWVEIDERATALSLAMPSGHNGASLQLLSAIEPHSLDVACAVTGAGVGATPSAIAAWLTTLHGLVVTTPRPVTIGGLTGVMVDLSVDPSATTCGDGAGGANGGSSSLPIFDPVITVPGDYVAVPPGLELTGDGRARYILLDRGDGRTLVMAIEANAATWDAVVADAMPIAESFEFTP